MTVEEMIAEIYDSSISMKKARKIINTLKAGQAMRDAMFDESKSDMDAADAWDAATKEEEG